MVAAAAPAEPLSAMKEVKKERIHGTSNPGDLASKGKNVLQQLCKAVDKEPEKANEEDPRIKEYERQIAALQAELAAVKAELAASKGTPKKLPSRAKAAKAAAKAPAGEAPAAEAPAEGAPAAKAAAAVEVLTGGEGKPGPAQLPTEAAQVTAKVPAAKAAAEAATGSEGQPGQLPGKAAVGEPKGTASKREQLPGKADPPPKRHRGTYEGEKIAQEAVANKDLSVETLTRVLRSSFIPFNVSRKNVIPEGQDGILGMVLGLFVFGGNIGLSAGSNDHPWLTRLLSDFLHDQHPDFPFTSIQVNKDYASRPHVDKNNVGSSLIIGFGEYEGGQTWVQDDDGTEELTVGEDIISPHNYRKGRTYKGKFLDIKDRLVEFDGNRLHYTTPFTGERYSLVFFTCDRYREASAEVREKHSDAGFRFAWSCPRLQQMVEEKIDTRRRLRKEIEEERREEIRQQRAKLGRCFGRTWNKGWGGACPHWRSPKDEHFCMMHAPGTWRTHGRIDGEIPKAKQEEMAKWQRIMTRNGESPPDPLPPGHRLFVPVPAGHSGMELCFQPPVKEEDAEADAGQAEQAPPAADAAAAPEAAAEAPAEELEDLD